MYTIEQAAFQLVEIGRYLHSQQLIPATSGNFSARLDDGSFAMTESGFHKGYLANDNIMRVDISGRSLDHRKPSAETLLHMQIYRLFEEAQVVIHPHSVNSTVLSKLCGEQLVFSEYEILKAFNGVTSHEQSLTVPVVENDQDIVRLTSILEAPLTQGSGIYAYLIRGHGYYTWGRTFEEARIYMEALEYLFSCELQLRR